MENMYVMAILDYNFDGENLKSFKNSVLKNDIIPMYESMVEDMKSSLIQYKGL